MAAAVDGWLPDFPDLSMLGLGGTKEKKKSNKKPKPKRDTRDPAMAPIAFRKMQLAEHKQYARPMEKFDAFQKRFYRESLRTARDVTGWSQVDTHAKRMAAFAEDRRGSETFAEFERRV